MDLQPNTSIQAVDRPDILNVGGFNDSVYDLMALFAKGEMSAEHWVGEINKIRLSDA